MGVNNMKKPYVEPEIEIENVTSLNTFLESSPTTTPPGWSEGDGDEGLDEWN
jgi:hypothetical protein